MATPIQYGKMQSIIPHIYFPVIIPHIWITLSLEHLSEKSIIIFMKLLSVAMNIVDHSISIEPLYLLSCLGGGLHSPECFSV